MNRVRSLGATLAISILLTACGIVGPSAIPTPVPDPPAPAAPTYIAQRGLVVRQIEFDARAQPVESQELSFVTEGKVQKVFKKPGDSVKAGEVIAELDVSDIRNELRQAQIEFNTAQVVLSNTLEGFTRSLQLAQLDVDQAQLRLDAANARAKAFGIGQAELQARQAEAKLLEKELERAHLKLADVGATLDPNLIKNVETSRISVEALSDKLGRATLVAPFDGTIIKLNVAVGNRSTPLEPVAVVSKPGEIELVADLPSQQYKELSVGQPVTARMADNPDNAFGATISRVPTENVARGDRLVRITLDNSDVQPGVKAVVSVTTGRRENALWVPANVVRNYRGRQFVVVQNDDGSQRRADVKLGLQASDRVEILDGLNEGDVVVAP